MASCVFGVVVADELAVAVAAAFVADIVYRPHTLSFEHWRCAGVAAAASAAILIFRTKHARACSQNKPTYTCNAPALTSRAGK